MRVAAPRVTVTFSPEPTPAGVRHVSVPLSMYSAETQGRPPTVMVRLLVPLPAVQNPQPSTVIIS